MSKFGAQDLDVIARHALLDALEVLEPHLPSLILIGAQAAYMHTNHIELNLAPATSDADIAIDTRILGGAPELSSLLRPAGYFENPSADGNPGHWLNRDGVPLDLYQPRALSDRPEGSRGAHIHPHEAGLLRIGHGMDCVLVDNSTMQIQSFDATDNRMFEMKVAGPAALLVAKTKKISEREFETGDRAAYKDALDVFRILMASESKALASSLALLRNQDICTSEAMWGIEEFTRLFAARQNAPGNQMVAAATVGVEDAESIMARSWALALDLVEALGE